ncbi:MAG: DEAD/DEAH box helicase [Gammaproteobacteria bacterium]|jgi:ATP-dependent RNA helicase RhlE|nr:DEAD/DEAH box helicase [Gammaproteobacteria bacterium]
MPFTLLGLSQTLNDHLTKHGYSTPTPIQAKAIPAILTGRDVMAAAQTGTGKTAAFSLPMLQRLATGGKPKPNQARALILTPTRELAAQVYENTKRYGEPLGIRSEVVYGGVKINPQMQRLRRGTDILVATPGRLLDLFQQRAIGFDELEILVLDEADRMLDMGFIHDLKRIIALLPVKRQNLMFSATFANHIRDLARGLMNHPQQIDVTPPNSTAQKVKQWLIAVDKKRKPALLIHLIKSHHWHQILVFSRTKHGANKLVKLLAAADISAAAIHGNKSQSARMSALANFKDNQIQVLVATDIAARGLDISQLPIVINLDLPNVAEDYVHRIGRTGRADQSGEALSLVCADEIDSLYDIERLIQKHIRRDYEPDFEPVHELPMSKPILPPKRKRPKKPKQTAALSSSDKPQPRSSAGKQANRAKSPVSKTGQHHSTRGQDKKAGNPDSSTSSPWHKPSNKAGKNKVRKRPAINKF